MNQQEKMAAAKKSCLARFGEIFQDFEQVDDYSFASLENVEGEEVWVVVNLVAKKNYDIDNALEEYALKAEAKAKRQKEKEKKYKTKETS